jgi:hypothetical protein
MHTILHTFRRIPFGLFCIILLALVFRLVWLDKVPTGITDDELGFVLNAKAVFLTGKDLSGVWSPFSLTPVTGEFPQAAGPSCVARAKRAPPVVAVLGEVVRVLTRRDCWVVFSRPNSDARDVGLCNYLTGQVM